MNKMKYFERRLHLADLASFLFGQNGHDMVQVEDAHLFSI
jgi:hypothetical protein